MQTRTTFTAVPEPQRGRVRQLALSTVTLLAGVAAVCLLSLNTPVRADHKQGHGGGGDNTHGGGNDFQDLDVCITLDPTGDFSGDAFGDYCGSEQRVTAAVGRSRSIALGVGDHRQQQRRFHLTLGSRLPHVPGDQDPAADGGIFADFAPLPVIPPEGITGGLSVAYRVNVLFMGEEGWEPNPMERNARLNWWDADGTRWTLLWGPHPQPGGTQPTNPDAPGVLITRRVDGAGNLINEWEVVTQADAAVERPLAATAFLFRWVKENPPQWDYCGAFDVFFAYDAIEER